MSDVVIAERLFGTAKDTAIPAPRIGGERPKERAKGNTGKSGSMYLTHKEILLRNTYSQG
jgi:hypothetical protein